MYYDVVVVGSGPIGATAARYAAIEGAEVLLIEEDAVIGSPVQCTGLLSTKAVHECDVNPNEDFVLNTIRGAYVYPPTQKILPIDGGKTKAYVVSRKIFDRTLFEMATNKGVDVKLKTKAIDIKLNKEIQSLTVLENGKMEKIDTKIIIAADGVKSKMAKMAGLGNPQRIMPGIQIETTYHTENPDFVELFVGSYVPGFFGWAVPINESISRVGLAVDCTNTSNAYNYLSKMIHQHPRIASAYKGGCIDLVYGGIPIGPLNKTYTDGIMIVGDAAGQTKPTSGGGIYTGAICAKIAGKIAASAQNASADYLQEYEKQWKNAVGKELNIGMKIHDFIKRLSDKELDDLLGAMNTPSLLETITKYGDMDKPSILIKKLLDPRKSKDMIQIFTAFARAVL